MSSDEEADDIVLESIPTSPSATSEKEIEVSVKETSSKRKFSGASQSPASSNKTQRVYSPPQQKMSAEEVQGLNRKVDSVQEALDKIVQQGTNTHNLALRMNDDMVGMSRETKETKALIAETARGFSEFRDYQISHNNSVNTRLTGVEADVAHLKGLYESGNHGNLSEQSQGYDHEAEHESNLANLISESEYSVTMLGADDPDMTIKKAILAMTKSFPGHGLKEEAIYSFKRMGAASSTNPPYQITLKSKAMAWKLIDLSKERSKKHRESKSGAPWPEGVRFSKNYPQVYAEAARNFRSMQAEVFKRGGMAAIEYEGTTLTLQAKSRAHGGQWLIMRGCEFRPEAVGRQVPQDSESEGMTKARVLLDSILDNRPDSDLAKSLYMHTKTTLGTIDLIKFTIGASLSVGLQKVDLKEKLDSKNIYTLLYSSRQEAMKALTLSRNRANLTDCNMDENTDWLTICVPIVGK